MTSFLVTLVALALVTFIQKGLCQGNHNETKCKAADYIQLVIEDTMSIGEPIFTLTPRNTTAEINLTTNCTFNNFLTVAVNDSQFSLRRSVKEYCFATTVGPCQLKCTTTGGSLVQMAYSIKFSRNNASDYPMQFENDTYVARVRENNVPNITTNLSAKLTFPTCTDGDFEDQSLFVNNTKDFDINSKGILTIRTSFNYERQNVYNLTLIGIKTIDADNNIKVSASATIRVEVIDVDDEDPAFDIDGAYSLNIRENDKSVIGVYQNTTPPIHAYDKDLGIDTPIEYTFLQDSSTFGINITTGQISVLHMLDRENKSSYSLIVKAYQADDSKRTATATLVVNVEDADDLPPLFESKYYEVSIPENSQIGLIVLTVTARDEDEGTFGQFDYKIAVDNVPFAINDQGKITVLDPLALDRENTSTFIFNIQTVPVNSSMTGDTASVTVHLIDVNDNNPIFNEKSYEFNVVDASSGITVGQVTATDEDLDANVTYAFVPSSDVGRDCLGKSSTFPFGIGNISGSISITGPVMCQYQVIAEACDNTPNVPSRRCNTVPVSINYTNETHVISDRNQTMHLLENVDNGTIVGKVQCSGSRYDLVGSSTFMIDRTGIVRTSGSVDREMNTNYSVEVFTYTGTSQVICNTSLTIHVIDVNDNVPEFSQLEYSFLVPDSPTDGVIGTVTATDRDTGDNGIVTYAFQSSWDSDMFMINNTSGHISLIKGEQLTRDIYSVIVVAKDTGQPAMKSIVSVQLYTGKKDTLPVSTPLTKDQLVNSKNHLEKELSRILDMQAKIEDNIDTLNGPGQKRSRMYVSALYRNGTKPSLNVLLRTGLEHLEEIQALFYTANCLNCSSVPPTHDDTAKFGTSEIALVVMAIVVLVGCIVAILVIRKQFNSHNRYKRLYENLTKNSSLYESQELKIKIEEETSDYNGSVNTQELQSMDDMTSGQSNAIVNPVFEDGHESTEVKEATGPHQDTSTEMEQALESLDHRLSREEDPPTDYENTVLKTALDGSTEYSGDGMEANDIDSALYANTTGDRAVVNPDHVNVDIGGSENVPVYPEDVILDQYSRDGMEANDIDSALYANTTGERAVVNPDYVNVDIGGSENVPVYPEDVILDQSTTGSHLIADEDTPPLAELSHDEQPGAGNGDEDEEEEEEDCDEVLSSKFAHLNIDGARKTTNKQKNQPDGSTANSPDEVNNADGSEGNEEPTPDYDIKQVRFSTEVLNTEANILEPLKTENKSKKLARKSKAAKSENDGEEDKSKTETTGDEPIQEERPIFLLDPSDEETEKKVDVDEQGWVEEEINSPNSFMSIERVDSTPTFNFGEEDAITSL